MGKLTMDEMPDRLSKALDEHKRQWDVFGALACRAFGTDATMGDDLLQLHPDEIEGLFRENVYCVEQANQSLADAADWLQRFVRHQDAAREKAAARRRGEYAG
jgi:hypothetical protein